MMLLRRLHDPAQRYTRPDLRREISFMLTALMEAMWLAPWLAVFMPGDQTAPYGVLLFAAANVLAALWTVRFLDAWGMYENLRQLVFFMGLALAVLLTVGVFFPPEPQVAVEHVISDNLDPVQGITFPPILPALILISVLWWRGLRLAFMTLSPVRVAFGMRLGIAIFFGAALLPEAQQVMIAALPPFFFFGLFATSMARAVSLRELWGHPLTFGRRWMISMGLIAVGITLAGFLIAVLLSGMDPAQILAVIQPIIGGIVLVIAVLMTPVLFLIQQIVTAIFSALDLNAGAFDNTLQVPDGIPGLESQGREQGPNALEQLLSQIEQLLNQLGGVEMCVSVFVVLAIVAVILLTMRQRRQALVLEGEEREDLDGDALGGLRNLLRRGMDALNNALNTVGQFGLGRNLFAALTVRRIYAQMAAQAADRGFPRAISETPYEYRAALSEAYPEGHAEIRAITEAYVRVHYGEVPASDEALQQVVDAWQRLKRSATASGSTPAR